MRTLPKQILTALLLALIPFSCQRVPDTIEPSVSYAMQDKYIQSLPSAFPPLSSKEKQEPFAQEMGIGLRFAQELDLYQAITAFKRAEFLLSPKEGPRLNQIQYEILLCYYMGKKWQDVVYTFDHSGLRYVDNTFPAFHDLLLILYETYMHSGMEMQAERILQVIYANYPEEAVNLQLSSALVQGEIPLVKAASTERPYLRSFLDQYEANKKGVGKTQLLNALVPGAGYLYLGQTQSAITAFCLNGLFIAASVYFFESGNIAAGAIFTSFEAGWYFGGIYGGGLEAKAYNERLYETLTTPLMMREKLFPGLMIRYAF